MDKSDYSFTGFSGMMSTTINEMKKIVKDNNIILEVGFGYGKVTNEIYKTFKNVEIYSLDNNAVMNQYKKRFKDFLEIYEQISDRTTFIITEDVSKLTNIRDFDFVLVDIGYNATDIIKILDSIKIFPNMLVMLPWSNEEKKQQRKIVLEYLERRNTKWEKLGQTSTIRIFDER